MNQLTRQFQIQNDTAAQHALIVEAELMSKYGMPTPRHGTNYDSHNKGIIKDLWAWIQKQNLPKHKLWEKVLGMHKTERITLSYGDVLLVSSLLERSYQWAHRTGERLGLIY